MHYILTSLMDIPTLFLVLSFFLASSPSSSRAIDVLEKGLSLDVEKYKEDVLVSPNGAFSAGFHPVGDNAFCFAIWFTKSSPRTVVWMANRDQPVNGRASKLSLLKDGNLILTDAGRITLWKTDTLSTSSVQLHLLSNGNLVLRSLENGTLWQSFDTPTDTLLPQQEMTKDTSLISSRSQTNYSSGFYKFYFDTDNVLRLLFSAHKESSIYWPDPGRLSWDNGRSTYNNSQIAVLSSDGHFSSTDNFLFSAADVGIGPQRRLTLDVDGNLRLYSLDEATGGWVVSWQAFYQPCTIHGICGPNSLCSYDHDIGRTCSCIPGFKMKNETDWSYGCEPEFNITCNHNEFDFVQLPYSEFYGYDLNYTRNVTFEECKNTCLDRCSDCKAFLLKFDWANGFYLCYHKALLLNGFRSPSFEGTAYLKLPKNSSFHKPREEFRLNCSDGAYIQLDRTYRKSHESGSLKFLLWFTSALGGVETAFFLLTWCLLFRTRQDSSAANNQGYLLAATGFKRFTYAELQKATQGFSEEIGRGGGSVVYRGILSDHRVAAIKRLNEANQGAAEFLAEVSTIGKINHMNLIEMWGYCVEGKHRLLVYEYMEPGSLAKNLSSYALDWEKRFRIAMGTAKGLAYLHEECLEWILHCDIKPQNILLDSNYEPKVADFGLSKLVNRGGVNNSSFSRIRGTRGYMAPEWVSNFPITSKVDVYSYGIVVLEMVTGKSSTMDVMQAVDGGTLVAWVREKKNEAAETESWIEEIIDPMMEGKYDLNKMEILVEVALQCVQENSDARPTMRQVVEMLQVHKDEYPTMA